MQSEVDITLKRDEIIQLYEKWTDRYDTCANSWAWQEVDERIWRILREAVDKANGQLTF